MAADQALYSFGTVMALIFAALIYRFGEEELGNWGIVWAARVLFERKP